MALINEVKPGIAPDVKTLDPTKRRSNCTLGLKVAHNHLKIPQIISADDLSSSTIDELSVMTYLSYFVEPAKIKLLKWVKRQIPQMNISNFQQDWSDGRAFAALINSRFPDLLHDWASMKPGEKNENVKKVFEASKKRLGIEPTFQANRLTKGEAEELQVMTYILRIQSAHLKALPDEIQVTGDGLKRATAGKQTSFEIDTSQAGPGKLSIDAYYDSGKKVKFVLRESTPSIATITYTPQLSGVIHFDILWSDTPIPKSPFAVSVTDSMLVRFIDFEHHSRLARVNIPISLSLDTKQAGPGTLTAQLDYGKDLQVTASIKKQPESVYNVQYIPPKAGQPVLRVFWNGEELRHLLISYKVVDSGNYRVVTKPEKKVYRTFELSSFLVESDGLPLDVLQMTAILGDVQIPIRFKSIEGNRGDASFMPTLPGVYRVEVACVDKLIEGCPFRVEVTDPSQCKPIGRFPKYLQLGIPHCFEVDMKSAGVGLVEFASGDEDQDNRATFHAIVSPTSNNGIQKINVTPKKSGEFLVGIKFHGAFIPSSPFRITVCDPTKCSASGDLISKKTGMVGKPIRFTIRVSGPSEGIKPTVKAIGPSAKYSAEIRTTDDSTYAVQFTPWEIGTHEITIQYGGFDIPKSPFLLAVTGVNSNFCSATGTGLQEAYTGVPSQFVVLAKQSGLLQDRTLQISVTGVVNNIDCKVRARDNENGSYNVAYLTQLPGAYLIRVLAGGKHIPGSPFKLNALPGPEADQCYMYGPALEPSSVLTIGKPIDFTVDTSEGGTGHLSVKAIGPRGAEARVYMAKAERKTYDVMLDPVRHGKYRVSVKWSGKHIQGSPFLLKVFPGADASKCKAYGPGLEDGFVGRASSFTIETRDAGAGTLKVRLHGVKDAFKIDIKPADQRDVRTLVARYDPRKPGEYLVTIKWTENHIPGSPFRVRITGDEIFIEEDTDSERTATQRHTDNLSSIAEESDDFEDEELETRIKEEKSKKDKKKKKKKKNGPIQYVPVPVVPMLVPVGGGMPVFDPRTVRTPYHNSLMPRQPLKHSGKHRTVSGASHASKTKRQMTPEQMMTFASLHHSRNHQRSATSPGQPVNGEYHGRGSIEMNTVTQRRVKHMKRSQSDSAASYRK